MPDLTHTQKIQIEDWLRSADKLIREGRYIAADEILQKVFQSDPGNEIAFSYQDRIQFLIKQLSQRVGLNNEIQGEIRKYRTIHLQRKDNQINALLVTAQKFLDDGYLKKAGEQASKALALDPENVYARTFIQRVTELQREAGMPDHDTENDFKLRSILKEAWRNGKPSEAQEAILQKMQSEFLITNHHRSELERDARNALYKEQLHTIWLTGGISAFTPGIAESLREKYAISRVDYSFIEASLLREVRKNRIKATVLLIDENDKVLLETATTLRTNGYAVIGAGTFEEVLGCIKAFTPDIIISEMFFQSEPVGFEIYELVRRTFTTKHTPFFFLSSSTDRSTEIIAKRLGVDDFLTKPIDYEMLLATISGRILHSNRSKKE